MRCPKCGFISFDHLEICLKCNKDISKTSAQVVGTTYNVAPPSFLRFQKSDDRKVGEERAIRFDNEHDEFAVIDPDLKILVDSEETGDDEDTEIPFEHDFGGLDELADDEGFQLAKDDDDMGIDLGQFEDAFEEKGPAFEDNDIDLNLPEELADISDLSAPAAAQKRETKPEKDWRDSPPAGGDSDMDLDEFQLDLDLEDLEDDFSLSSPGDIPATKEDDLDIGGLSLDDLGLADMDEQPASKKKKPADAMDMDGDLNFDLDLGGMSMNKD